MARSGVPGEAMLELGCFDGKLLGFLPRLPATYKGFDAGWENGLESAKTAWKERPEFSFQKSETAAEMRLDASERFDTAVSMETLEHLPPDAVSPYLKKIAAHLEGDGHFFVTVPNEIGLVFLVKWLAKFLLFSPSQKHSPSEFVNTVLGRSDRVARREHKGFDYRALLREMGEHFEIVSVAGYPFRGVPLSLSFGIGIVARARSGDIRKAG